MLRSALFVLFLSFVSAKVFDELILTEQPDFVYVTKFAYDPDCSLNISTDCTLNIAWEAEGNSNGTIVIYDDKTWLNAWDASTCQDKLAVSMKPGAAAIAFSGSGNTTVYVTESYEHWWYIAVANCNQGMEVTLTLTFLNHGSQFGYNEQGMLPLYIVFLVMQSIMLIALFFIKKFSFLSNSVSSFVAVALLIEAAGLLLAVLHWATYAVSGSGIVQQGNWLQELATCVMLAGILYGGAGWSASSINTFGKFSKQIFIACLVAFSLLYIVLIIWAIVERNSWWFTDYAYESVPGTLVMLFRMLIALWFLFTIYHTIRLESNKDKRKVYFQFAITSFVWLWSVPICSFIGYQVPSFFQLKAETTLFLICDTCAFVALLTILRPSVVEKYFTTAGIVGSSLQDPVAQTRLQEEFLSTDEKDEDRRL